MVYKESERLVRVAGLEYRDGVRNLEVMLESEWREEAGNTGRRNSYCWWIAPAGEKLGARSDAFD